MSPQRIQLRRTKGWRKPEGAITVARPSRWGNQFVVTTFAEQRPNYVEHVADEFIVAEIRRRRGATGAKWAGFASKDEATVFAVELFRRTLLGAFGDVDGAVHREYYLGELTGHDLACWCALDAPCHADVLLELANPEADR